MFPGSSHFHLVPRVVGQSQYLKAQRLRKRTNELKMSSGSPWKNGTPFLQEGSDELGVAHGLGAAVVGPGVVATAVVPAVVATTVVPAVVATNVGAAVVATVVVPPGAEGSVVGNKQNQFSITATLLESVIFEKLTFNGWQLQNYHNSDCNEDHWILPEGQCFHFLNRHLTLFIVDLIFCYPLPWQIL